MKNVFCECSFYKNDYSESLQNAQENVLNGGADFIIVFHIFQVAEVAPRIFFEKSCS